MSLTLGEKLREAREERGLTIADIAEQTRISALYLGSIENDDYKILPGGIFNKGFVKSYAKFVGINETEALSDYAALAQSSAGDEQELKVYRPEVLTDDRSGSSMVPTVVIAVVILGLMTGGILFLVDYMRRPVDPPVANLTPSADTRPTGDTPTEVKQDTPEKAEPSGAPDMATLKVEFKAVSQPVFLTATNDGTKTDIKVAAGTSTPFEPKESLTLNYNRWNASAVELTINGKVITLPSIPLNPKDKRIEFTIGKDNIAQIWKSGAISTEVPAVDQSSNANVGAIAANTAIVPGSAPTPLGTPTRANTATKQNAATNTAAASPTPDKKASDTPVTMQGKPANRP